MVKKNTTLILFVSIFIVLISLNLASAFSIKAVTPSYINRTIPTIINFTINNTDVNNITQITFTLPMEARYYGGNGTDASGTFFSNSTGGSPPKITLTWTNLTAIGIIKNNSAAQSFWFNATLRNLGSAFFTNITINVSYTSGANTYSSHNYVVNFAFSGYVKNETGGYEGNVNLTMYQFVEGQNGPPTSTADASTLSAADGSFTFTSINGSATAYKLKMVRYGSGTNCIFLNSTCNAIKTGPVLQDFPAMMYYPTTADNSFAFEFMRPPSLNGTTFYLQPATTLRLYANNNSDAQKFGYQVVDQVVGFPIESNAMTSVSTVDVIVPTGRNYTVMFSRFPSGSSGFQFSQLCDGSFMNDTLCPSPPISNSSLGTLTEGGILILNQSLVITKARLYGCIDTGGKNNSNLNITALNLKMVPWQGFVPPARGDMGNINLTTDINYSVSTTPINCLGKFAFYNISVMAAASGLNYMLEIYAKNASDEAGNPGTANNLAVFQNISITNNTYLNLTLQKLAGSYYPGSLNTSRIRINIQNSSGGAITNKLNANIKIKNPALGTVTYMIESMSNGQFYIPIMNNSNWAKIMIFAQDSPPKEITLNLSSSEQNITLVTMSDGDGVGMKRINSSGQMEMINSSSLNSTMSINMRFLRNTGGGWGTGCNVLDAPTSCELTTTSAKNFNPLTALVAGNINMEMKITSTNVSLTFVNFDMLSAKQPPMDSIVNDQASSGGSSASQIWQFGSFAPRDSYQYVIISMPYSDSVINDSSPINLSAPLLYDENWNVIWNSSRGDTAVNLTDDFTDYNSTSLYKNYLTSGGLACSSTDSNLNVTPCFINTTSNMIYMRIPHFSGVAPGVTGSSPSTASSTTSSTTSGSGGTTSSWTNTYVPTDLQLVGGFEQGLKVNERIKIIIDSKDHYVGVKSLTATTATLEIASVPVNATMNIGDVKKFDVTGDGYYDLKVILNSIANNKADITVQKIYEKMPAEAVVNDVVNNVVNTGKNIANKIKSNLLIVVLAAIIIIIIISISYKVSRKKRYHKKGY